jgi:hypothetical protein
MMLWIIGVVFFTLFVLFILYLCITTDAPPGRTNYRPHADLQEFRNQQRFDSPFRDETISEQYPTEDRAVVVKRSLNSHTFQPGESVKNLSAALHVHAKSTSSNSISSSSSRNEQPQRSMSAHWRNGMEASVRSLKESVHSAYIADEQTQVFDLLAAIRGRRDNIFGKESKM